MDFANGDATTVPYKNIVIAAGEGAKAAMSAFEHLIRFDPHAWRAFGAIADACSNPNSTRFSWGFSPRTRSFAGLPPLLMSMCAVSRTIALCTF
jgi:hypothetical protein